MQRWPEKSIDNSRLGVIMCGHAEACCMEMKCTSSSMFQVSKSAVDMGGFMHAYSRSDLQGWAQKSASQECGARRKLSVCASGCLQVSEGFRDTTEGLQFRVLSTKAQYGQVKVFPPCRTSLLTQDRRRAPSADVQNMFYPSLLAMQRVALDTPTI